MSKKDIQIRGYFQAWKTVDVEFAKEYIESKLRSIPWKENVFEYINHQYLRGIEVQNLLKDNEILEKVIDQKQLTRSKYIF